MTRIVAGRWGGRTLITPAGTHTRPTGEKVRAALANSLFAGGGLAGARVLDLFAGSGAVGLELVSRGAASAVLVDSDRDALAAARTNVKTLGAAEVEVVAADVLSFAGTAAQSGAGFDVVVADPPYTLSNPEFIQILELLVNRGLLGIQADVIVERPKRAGELEWPDPMVGVRVKKYGDTLLCYGRAP